MTQDSPLFTTVKTAFAEAWCASEHEYHVAGDEVPCLTARRVAGLEPGGNLLLDYFMVALDVSNVRVCARRAHPALRSPRAGHRRLQRSERRGRLPGPVHQLWPPGQPREDFAVSGLTVAVRRVLDRGLLRHPSGSCLFCYADDDRWPHDEGCPVRVMEDATDRMDRDANGQPVVVPAPAEARDALIEAFGALGGGPVEADILLAALPDGWTLARREDAEDGAARDALALLIDAAETLHGSAISERLGLHRPIACDVVGECYVSEALAAARKAKDALGGAG